MSASTPLAGDDRGHYGLQDRNHYPARRIHHQEFQDGQMRRHLDVYFETVSIGQVETYRVGSRYAVQKIVGSLIAPRL